MMPMPAVSGQKTQDGESGVDWYLFNKILSVEEIAMFIEINNLYPVSPSPGSFYARKPNVQIGRNRTLITWRWGYDI